VRRVRGSWRRRGIENDIRVRAAERTASRLRDGGHGSATSHRGGTIENVVLEYLQWLIRAEETRIFGHFGRSVVERFEAARNLLTRNPDQKTLEAEVLALEVSRRSVLRPTGGRLGRGEYMSLINVNRLYSYL
jgi:hypothetical protein